MERTPTLRELAVIAGVSHQTVALAIRNSPKLAPATRKRLQLLAKESGYRRNPHVSAWAAYVRTKKAQAGRATLAIVGPISPDSARQYSFYSEFHSGARAEADFLGYELDFFALSDFNHDWKRIKKIMKARGIRGCMVFCQFLGGEINLEWDDFAVVSLDRAGSQTQFDFASSDHYKVMTMALENLRRLGYRRIGFYGGLNPHLEDLSRWRGAFAADLLYRRPEDRVPMEELKVESPPAESILRWWKKYRPDVIVSSYGQEAVVLQEAGVRVPQDVAIIKLDVAQNDRHFSGINQLLPWVAAAAVRLLVEKLERNETGIPAICRGIVIQPVWKNGKTAPPVRNTARGSKRQGSFIKSAAA